MKTERHDELMRAAGDQVAPVAQRLFVPSQQQLRYLRAYLDPATPANIKAVAAAAHVNRRNIYRWFDDAEFCAWFKEQCERLLQHRIPRMWMRCIELAEQGSPEHIKLVAMKTGELRQDAPNGRGPGMAAVFINVPRPPRERDDDIDVQPFIRPVISSGRSSR
jgi:hypothetical protein